MDWAAPLVHDENAIRAIVPIPNVDQSDVEFHLEIGRAILIAPTLDRELTDEELRSINRKSNWDVFVFSRSEFDDIKSRARRKFSQILKLNDQMTDLLVDNACFGFDDLSVIDPDWLIKHSSIDSETVDVIIKRAEIEAERLGGDGV